MRREDRFQTVQLGRPEEKVMLGYTDTDIQGRPEEKVIQGDIYRFRFNIYRDGYT